MQTADEVTGPVNLGNPVEFTIGQLAETVISLTGSSSKIAYQPLPEDDPRQRCPDISLAQNLLAWAPRVQLRDGLIKTIEYFEQLLRSDARDDRLPMRPVKAAG
jgi:UDP-glucuronate decarboxylase